MKELARRGAQMRLQELQQEINEIRRAFPGLGAQPRGRGRARRTAASARTAVGRSARSEQPRKRTRKPLTAAQRKAIGERMTKYWAARRKSEKSEKSEKKR